MRKIVYPVKKTLQHKGFVCLNNHVMPPISEKAKGRGESASFLVQSLQLEDEQAR